MMPKFHNIDINPLIQNIIQKLLKYDRPDIILVKEGVPKLVIEKTREVPTGHNVGQRFARLVNAVESKKLITKIDSDLDIDLYIKSTKFLIKAIGYNYVQKPTPNEFLTFYFHNAVDSMPTITFGNNFSKNDEIVQLFKVF